MTEIAVAGGLFLGCLARALLPFFKKQYQAAEQGGEVKWEKRYAWTIIFAIFASFITATLLFPSFEMPAVNAFPIAFAIGWASQDILNLAVK
ncbi:hypothetical protein MUP77_18795 [Candidatus Bathyarchaeota archaeon]|nr:hypothetical protein [Candidatus Bathyarchaeota archaeon]